MNFPAFPDKQNEPGVLTPSDILALGGQNTRKHLKAANSAILCFQSVTVKYLSAKYGGNEAKGFSGSVTVLKKAGEHIVVARTPGLGAPAVAVILEELAASGIRRCIAIGVAGALQNSITVGGVILPTGAIRDEGTSHHYLSADEPASPSEELLHRFTNTLDRRNQEYLLGKIWTTDAPYRETAGEIHHYEREGILGVDMETSAFLCVCSYLKIPGACGLVAADLLAGGKWQSRIDKKKLNASLWSLADAAVETLRT